MSHYKHLTIEERESLYLLRNQGVSLRKIAQQLGRSASTISRELKRNKGSHRPYRPSSAQTRYEKVRKHCGRTPILAELGFREIIRTYIEDKHWSPEQIENRLKAEHSTFHISYATIYRAIWSGVFDPCTKYVTKSQRFTQKLRKKGKRKKKNGTVNKQGKLIIQHTISERPAEANDRSAIGHWEADTVAGKKGTSALVTLTDRRSRFLLARKVPNVCAETVADAMIQLLKPLPIDKVKSVTPDRGHEFAKHADVSAAVHNVPFFFADPYSPWQRGTNENTNGLLRECLPKYTDMTPVPDDLIDDFIYLLNLRPRKCLGWLSPYEVFFNISLHLT